MRPVLGQIAGVALLSALLAGCAILTPLPQRVTLSERLAVFPTVGLPLRQPVIIYWDDHQIPFIEAAHDEDLAVALGLVHAHLRLGQMEALRRVSQGRMAEVVGPLATDIDHALRIVNFGAAVPDMIEALPAETRLWLEAFVRGVNHYQERMVRRPHEFAVLAIKPEPWSVADLLTIGRLASADVNWLVWFQLLKPRERRDWPQLWARLVDEGTASVPSYVAAAPSSLAQLSELLAGLSRSGSNSLAVNGARSASGSALMASDPHLGISLPNLWLVAGYKSPSYHAVGLMIPGLPFVAVGRNPWIAWGGTNLRAASSDLYDVSSLPADAIEERREHIAVRGWFDRDITVRVAPHGPIVTDAPMLDSGPGTALALRWIGHRPSDEMTAMLNVNRARDWPQFRASLAGFAISGQNMLYADANGHVGQTMAAHLPRRALGRPADMVLEPDATAHWNEVVTGRELSARFDPAAGYLASANNRGAHAEVPVGYFFSPNDRIERLSELLESRQSIGVDDLARVQRDVYMASAVALRDRFVARLESPGLSGRLDPEHKQLVARLAAWDGHYSEDSQGALAFELLLHHFVEAYYDETALDAYSAAGRMLKLIRDDVAGADESALAPVLVAALDKAAEAAEGFTGWGDMHRLGLAHPLSFLPLIGSRYRFADLPAAGSRSTVMKTAHALTGERHFTRYGSNARHISDLSDDDRNYFVLLGGQDGWFGSTTFMDQVALWQRGDYVEVPLRLDTVRAKFSYRTELAP